MPTTDVKARIDGLFPRIEDIPAAADFAPNGGTYPNGNLYLVDGEVRRWTGESQEVTSPVCVTRDGATARRVLGRHAALSREEALSALAAATHAFDNGRGAWPIMKVGGCIEAVQAFAGAMQKTREEAVRLLMWEIGKTRPDAEKEFDRTVQEDETNRDLLRDILLGRTSNFINTDYLF